MGSGVLASTKEKVLGKQAELRGKKLDNLDPQLQRDRLDSDDKFMRHSSECTSAVRSR